MAGSKIVNILRGVIQFLLGKKAAILFKADDQLLQWFESLAMVRTQFEPQFLHYDLGQVTEFFCISVSWYVKCRQS